MARRGADKTERGKPKRGDGTLGHLLQSLRQKKSITGEELARRLGTSQATVSKIETGVQKPTMEYVVRFASEIGLSKAEATDLLMRLNLLPSGLARDRTAELLSLDFVSGDDAKRQRKAMEEFEGLATVIRVFEPQGIPDILQTEEYARSSIRLSGITDPDPAERLVGARLKRQKHVGKKQYIAVLTEGALRARICSCPEMVSQIERVKSFGKAENSRLGIIAWHARLIVTLPPAFEIYDNTLVCAELPHRTLCLTREKDIQVYLRLFDALEKMTVVGKEAVSVLDRIIQDLRRLNDLESAANVLGV